MVSNLSLSLLLLLPLAGSAFELSLHLTTKGAEELDSTFWAIATPSSDRYAKFLEVEELAAMIGSDQSCIDAASAFLKQSGGENLVVSPLKDSITATFLHGHSLLLSDAGHPKSTPDCVKFTVRKDHYHEGVYPRPRASASASAPDADYDYTISKIKNAYGMPTDLTAINPATSVMTWGPGTFGYSVAELEHLKLTQAPKINLDKVVFDNENHGEPGGDNFGEGQLDVNMLSAFALNATVIVSNTNTSSSTEESTGFGAALLDFLTELAGRETVPHVLSMSLGSLSAASCDLLCDAAIEEGYSQKDCDDYLAKQRQVCMFLTQDQTDKISMALQVLGTRGVTVLAASGDGGSHFSFQAFESDGGIGDVLNEASCANSIPVFPTASPYVLSIGGEMWRNGNSDHPITWSYLGSSGSGGGFSIQFDQPEHQKDVVAEYLKKDGMPPADSYNAGSRAYPDMAAVGVSGTSQSCPISAGMFAMIIDKRLNAGLPGLGFVAPRLYEVATKFPGEAFQDIVGGDSSTTCDTGFPATDGWDANTGFGRPIWDGWAKHFGEDN
jgi:tripeptidyl-peptidase-1